LVLSPRIFTTLRLPKVILRRRLSASSLEVSETQIWSGLQIQQPGGQVHVVAEKVVLLDQRLACVHGDPQGGVETGIARTLASNGFGQQHRASHRLRR